MDGWVGGRMDGLVYVHVLSMLVYMCMCVQTANK